MRKNLVRISFFIKCNTLNDYCFFIIEELFRNINMNAKNVDEYCNPKKQMCQKLQSAQHLVEVTSHT